MSAPTSADPVVIDFGTSAAAEGKVQHQFQKKLPCPGRLAHRSQGPPTTDPAALYNEPRGNLAPFGGTQAYKGFGLGLLVDCSAAGSPAARVSNPAFPLPGIGNAAVFILLDPKRFLGADHFVKETDGLSAYVRCHALRLRE